LSLLLGSCIVRLPVSEAVAVPVSENEAATLDAQARPSMPGKWFKVSAALARDVVQKISRWELYTHMRVEDCRTGDLVGIASSVGIEGADGDFELTRKQLEANEQRQTFVIAEPVYFPTAKPLDRLCVRLEGGSYTLQRISSSPVALKVEPKSE
jgi:hypothetical protein|tara:strand:- start:2481 stop:2942 length:462 start_codon:yes stop_codon:yes gene_type:complete